MSLDITKVLIVDDDAISRSPLSSMLTKKELPFVEASNGKEGWDLIRTDSSFRLAIVDWMMPEVDGIELCRRIKSRPTMPFVYVIILTSRNSSDEVIIALDAGADDYIPKPPDLSILRARIDAGLRTIAMHDRLKNYADHMEKLASQRAEQLIHADRLMTIGILGAGIAHEINNAMTYVSVNINVINKYWKDIEKSISRCASALSDDKVINILKEMPAILQEMLQGIVRVKDIADGLKSYSRQESLRKECVDIHQCIENSLKICSARITKSITIKKSFGMSLPKAFINRQRIEQVFVNLLLNASDAIDNHDQGIIELSTSSANDTITIAISDNGSGLQQNAGDRLFNPFFTTKEAGKGTGLGLYICKNIIEEHNGTIKAINNLPGGTTFIVTLPVEQTV